MKTYTLNEGDLQRIYNYPFYSRDIEITSNKGFLNIDNGEQGGTHWTAFYIKDNKFG